jgi:exonuclease VII small subunit
MYERGQFLIGHCRGVLSRAQKQIEVLGKADAPGAPPAEDPVEEPAEEDEQESGDVENGRE